MKKLILLLLLVIFSGTALYHFYPQKIEIAMDYAKQKILNQKYTVAERMTQFGEAAQQRLAEHFAKAKVTFPPQRIRLLAFKDTWQLELYAPDQQGQWRKVRDYPIQAGSGVVGPKLREGDKQVPEGFYGIEAFNPNSRFHVSLRLNYPNPFDLKMAQADQRENPGSDIMIHGKALSVGCLAMGDEVAEELFALTSWVGRENVKVIIAPTDFRQSPGYQIKGDQPGWLPGLYQNIRAELANFPQS